jgi:hypothetical protein
MAAAHVDHTAVALVDAAHGASSTDAPNKRRRLTHGYLELSNVTYPADTSFDLSQRDVVVCSASECGAAPLVHTGRSRESATAWPAHADCRLSPAHTDDARLAASPLSRWAAVCDWSDMAGVLAEHLTSTELRGLRGVSRGWRDAVSDGLMRSMHKLSFGDLAAHAQGNAPVRLLAPEAMQRVERLDLRGYASTCSRWSRPSRRGASVSCRVVAGSEAGSCYGPEHGFASFGSSHDAWLRAFCANPASCARLRSLLMGASLPRKVACALLAGCTNLAALALPGMQRADDDVSSAKRRDGMATQLPPVRGP